MYTYIHYICLYKYVHVYTIYMFIYVCTCIYIIYIYISMYTYIHYICLYMCVCICIDKRAMFVLLIFATFMYVHVRRSVTFLCHNIS